MDGGLLVDVQWVDRFESYLRRSVTKTKVEAICEELSEAQVLNSPPRDAVSIAKTVATAFGIEHVFCDPNRDERRAMYDARGTTEEVDRANGFPVREEYWLEKIRHLLPNAPALFICGANHVPAFGRRLRDRGVDMIVLHRDLAEQWGFGHVPHSEA
jgi:hypothetical protein